MKTRFLFVEFFMRMAFSLTLLLPGMASASGLTRFDFPRAKTTCATAMASNGTIAGLASDGTLAKSRAFTYANGRFSEPKPDVPTGHLYLSGINRWRALVGSDLTIAQLGAVAFVYSHGRTTTPAVVSLNGITDSGILLGTVSIGNGSFPPGSRTVAFTQTKAGTKQILDDGNWVMSPMGIDPTGKRVVGMSTTNLGSSAWSYFDGGFTLLSVPGATQGTWPYAVDSHGTVRGFYLAGTPQAPVAHGFIFASGAYTTYDVPGATSTQITAANESGEIAGCYSDESGTHGFYATP